MEISLSQWHDFVSADRDLTLCLCLVLCLVSFAVFLKAVCCFEYELLFWNVWLNTCALVQEICTCLGAPCVARTVKSLPSGGQAAAPPAPSPTPSAPSVPPTPASAPMTTSICKPCLTPWQCRLAPLERLSGFQAVLCVQCFDDQTGGLPSSPLSCVTSDMSQGL